jgi:hypothetical protein
MEEGGWPGAKEVGGGNSDESRADVQRPRACRSVCFSPSSLTWPAAILSLSRERGIAARVKAGKVNSRFVRPALYCRHLGFKISAMVAPPVFCGGGRMHAMNEKVHGAGARRWARRKCHLPRAKCHVSGAERSPRAKVQCPMSIRLRQGFRLRLRYGATSRSERRGIE